MVPLRSTWKTFFRYTCADRYIYIYIYINYIRFKDNRWDLRLGISSLDSCQTWDLKSEQLSDFGSQAARIQDPRFSTNFSWIQGRNLGSGSKIQDFQKKSWMKGRNPRSKIGKTCAATPAFERHAEHPFGILG